MATSTKRDFSNFGLLENQARRYYTLWKHYCKSNENNLKEQNERGEIRYQIHKLVGSRLGYDIINSLEDNFDYLFTGWRTANEHFGFLLGIVTGLGFKKMTVVVDEEDVQSILWTADRYGWSEVEHDQNQILESYTITFINTNLFKD